MRTVLLQHSQAMAMARAEAKREVRAREASAEREAARLRASGMALIGKGRGFGGAGVFESAKAARKFRLPLLPRDPRRPRPTKKEKLKPWGGAKFSGQVEWEYAIQDSKEQVEKDYAIKDSKEQVEWEPVVLGYFWKNGRVKFGYVMIEKEKIEKFGYVNRPRAIDTRGGGGAVDGVFTTDKRQQPAVARVQRITKTATHP